MLRPIPLPRTSVISAKLVCQLMFVQGSWFAHIRGHQRDSALERSW